MGETFCPGNEQKIHRQTDTRRHRVGGWEKLVLVVPASKTWRKEGKNPKT